MGCGCSDSILVVERSGLFPLRKKLKEWLRSCNFVVIFTQYLHVRIFFSFLSFVAWCCYIKGCEFFWSRTLLDSINGGTFIFGKLLENNFYFFLRFICSADVSTIRWQLSRLKWCPTYTQRTQNLVLLCSKHIWIQLCEWKLRYCPRHWQRCASYPIVGILI